MFGTYGTLRDWWTTFFAYGTFMGHMGHGSDRDIKETIGTFSIEAINTPNAPNVLVKDSNGL